MKCVVLLFLTVLTFRVGSIPTPHEYRQDTAFENLFDYEDDVNEDINHNIFKKSINTNRTFSEIEVESEENVQGPCRVIFPTLKDLSDEYPQDIYEGGPDFLHMGVYPPRVPSYPHHVPYEKWTKYDLDYISQDPMDYRAAYNGNNLPFMYNPVPSIRFLPPVMTTRIRETISPMTDNEYDIDTDNEMYFPPYVRAVRSRDYLDQLREDAVMQNIVPTMPYPYMRSAVPSLLPSPQQLTYQQQLSSSYAQSGPVAYYPSAPASDCAVPMLVSCTPQITYGSLTNAYGGQTGPSLTSLPIVPVTYKKKSVSEILNNKAP